MKKYHLYIFGALSLSGFLHQLSCNYSNGCRKVLAKYVFCCGLGAHNPECSVTSFYSVKESACHLQQHKKLLAMHIAWMKVLVLIFSKFQIIFPWPFLCFIPKKIPYSFLWLKCLWEASPVGLPAAVFQNCRSLSTYGPQNISLGKIPRLFAK